MPTRLARGPAGKQSGAAKKLIGKLQLGNLSKLMPEEIAIRGHWEGFAVRRPRRRHSRAQSVTVDDAACCVSAQSRHTALAKVGGSQLLDLVGNMATMDGTDGSRTGFGFGTIYNLLAGQLSVTPLAGGFGGAFGAAFNSAYQDEEESKPLFQPVSPAAKRDAYFLGVLLHQVRPWRNTAA